MLRVTTIHANTAAASARYYTRYLAQDGPEGEGHWLGRRAESLGLAGRVETADLEPLLSGHDPATGKLLGTPLVDRYRPDGRVVHAVAGFDATFSAPKSLSVWWGLTGDPGLLEAHDIAVRAVLEHLERFGATTRVRVDGARQHPDVDGLVMAAFRQATSREDDPQLHTHVVISTKVQAPNGRWMALDARYLKRKQRALGGLYQSVLRAELTHRYGVAWGPIENGQAEIVGMPRELLDAFSKRAAQVNAALADKVAAFREREGRDPTRWERAAMTREAAADSRLMKSGAGVGDLVGGWLAEARDLGWTPSRLVEAMEAAARQVPTPDSVSVEQVVDQLSTAGSSWMRADVLQAICDLAQPMSPMSGLGWAAALDDAVERVAERCTTLDPPADRAPTRASDGRSIWIAPVEPHLTDERILAQEERILAFALEAHNVPPRPSPTGDRSGLDVLQADAAASVAGHDTLVVIVGPAGTGKTTTLRRAADDLRRQRRVTFGVAPTAKGAKVLCDEAAIAADTVAKLLYEWRLDRPPNDRYRLPRGSTLVVDEAGMVGTSAFDDLMNLAVSQEWRLVLVGDPRQLQAVGRGGMFDQLCRMTRAHELATIHRFRHRWEQVATLQLRAGNADALDAYFDHDRITAGSLRELLDEAARRWVDHGDSGRSVAMTAETNEHVAQLNRAIQEHRRTRGELGANTAAIAGGETAAVGDLVVTRRNDRSLVTDMGQPVRNRERWRVTSVGNHGELTVSHLGRHGSITLPPDYVRSDVQLGYAATAHGHQSDTVAASMTLVTPATTHRSLYVGATRGRDENRLLVVTDSVDPVDARDVLEQVLTNERADTPAVAQRRNLAAQQPRTSGWTEDTSNPPKPAPASTPSRPVAERAAIRTAEERLATARQALDDARRLAEPALRSVHEAETEVRAPEDVIRVRRTDAKGAPWRRRRLAQDRRQATARLDDARSRLENAKRAAVPYVAAIEVAEDGVQDAERDVRTARCLERLERMTEADLTRQGRDRGVELDGLGL